MAEESNLNRSDLSEDVYMIAPCPHCTVVPDGLFSEIPPCRSCRGTGEAFYRLEYGSLVLIRAQEN